MQYTYIRSKTYEVYLNALKHNSFYANDYVFLKKEDSEKNFSQHEGRQMYKQHPIIFNQLSKNNFPQYEGKQNYKQHPIVIN